MKALRAFNGYTIPFTGGWPVHEASYLCNGKPRIFNRGQGRLSYPTKGKHAWTPVEIPDPPKEPDDRFCEPEDYRKWHAEWYAYAREYGLPVAATGTICCELYIADYTISKFTQHHRYPPVELTSTLERVLGVQLHLFDTMVTAAFGCHYILDIVHLSQRLFRLKNVDFERWNSEVDQSVREWIAEYYGESAAAGVEALMAWKPDPVEEERYREFVAGILKQRDEALATCKKVK